MADPIDVPQAPPDEPVVIILTLDEFCARLSTQVRRTELIGGFHFSERVAGHLTGTEAEFRDRFDTFINKPVGV